jgi:hypothetical protein
MLILVPECPKGMGQVPLAQDFEGSNPRAQTKKLKKIQMNKRLNQNIVCGRARAIPAEQAPFTQLCAGLIVIGGTMTVTFYNGVLRNYLSPEIIIESE